MVFSLSERERWADGTPAPAFEYTVAVQPDGSVLGFVIDLDYKGRVSVTNSVGRIADILGADSLIYKDSTGQWDFWSKKTGFVSLASEGRATRKLMAAMREAERKKLILTQRAR